MKLGIITKVAVTPANMSDGKAFRHVCPKESMVFADKEYCGKEAHAVMGKKGFLNSPSKDCPLTNIGLIIFSLLGFIDF